MKNELTTATLTTTHPHRSSWGIVLVALVFLGAGQPSHAALPPSLTQSNQLSDATVPSKAELLNRFKAMQDAQNKETAVIEELIGQKLKESHDIALDPQNLVSAKKKIGRTLDELELLRKRHNDAMARLEVIDHLLLAVDTKWQRESSKSSQALQDFFEAQLLDMASTDLLDPRGGKLYKSFLSLSIAVREIPEKHESVVAVIEGYMRFSGTLDPKSPADYLSGRDYINAGQSFSVPPIARDRVGDLVEASLASESAKKEAHAKRHAKNRAIPTMELRLPQPLSQAQSEVRPQAQPQAKSSKTIEPRR